MTRQDKKSKIVDPFLLKVLEQHRGQDKFTDILRTIQKEQNEIVDYDFHRNIIVQGCAGSGKTMILFHRLANILYNKDAFETPLIPSRIAVIIPNTDFRSYIEELTWSLGINTIRTMTMDEYVLSKIEEIITNIFRDEGNDNYYSSGRSQKDGGIALLMRDIKNQFSNESNSSSEEILYDFAMAERLSKFINLYQDTLRLMIIKRNTERDRLYTNKNTNPGYNHWLNSSLREIRQYRKESINNFKSTFLNGRLTRGYMLSLIRIICENEKLSEYRPTTDSLLMIDEGQDYGNEEYQALVDINPNCVVNIFGDIDQKVYDRGLDEWHRAIQLFDAKYFSLNQDYRNSAQIVDFVNELLGKNILSVGFSTKDVEYIETKKLPVYLEYEGVLLHHNIAIITESPELYTDLPNGVKVMTVKQIKGLEFDTVIISPEIMRLNRSYQYIALTRALKHLYVMDYSS